MSDFCPNCGGVLENGVCIVCGKNINDDSGIVLQNANNNGELLPTIVPQSQEVLDIYGNPVKTEIMKPDLTEQRPLTGNLPTQNPTPVFEDRIENALNSDNAGRRAAAAAMSARFEEARVRSGNSQTTFSSQPDGVQLNKSEQYKSVEYRSGSASSFAASTAQNIPQGMNNTVNNYGFQYNDASTQFQNDAYPRYRQSANYNPQGRNVNSRYNPDMPPVNSAYSEGVQFDRAGSATINEQQAQFFQNQQTYTAENQYSANNQYNANNQFADNQRGANQNAQQGAQFSDPQSVFGQPAYKTEGQNIYIINQVNSNNTSASSQQTDMNMATFNTSNTETTTNRTNVTSNEMQSINTGTPYAPEISTKSRTLALILAFFLGPLGIHRFYMGRIGLGILFLLTGGVFGIGYIVDLILIACGNCLDGDGKKIIEW